MFVYSFKVNKRKMFALIIGVVLLIVGAVVMVNMLVKGSSVLVEDNELSETFFGIGEDNSVTIQSENDVIEFVESFGWEVSSNEISVKELTVPAEFNDVYTQYNELQIAQGYDLTDYCSKIVSKYTLEVLNYPDLPNFIRANVLVYEDVVIGGDICSISIEGFVHGFAWENNLSNESEVKSTVQPVVEIQMNF